jgi:hypothetical protein
MADSSAVRVPIPNRDLVYDEAIAPPVQLWRLPVEGESQIMGYVSASFPGLPRWSDRTGTMIYNRHNAIAQEMYDLYLAGEDGGDPQLYADGSLEILDAQWIRGQERFVFLRGTTLMLGERNQSPQTVVESVGRWMLAGNYVICTGVPSPMTDLRYTRIDDAGQPALIAAVQESVVFDAVVAP